MCERFSAHCRTTLLVGLVLLVLSSLLAGAAPSVRSLTYAPAPADNPLKGFVPYAGAGKSFPHSLEFNYLPLSALMKGPKEFDWRPLEKLLDDIAGRGNQAVFRIYLEYPGKPVSTPQYLVDAGVKIRRWKNTNTAPFPAKYDHTPDYEDPRMREALRNFIAALGKRYDGDPRIGYITAGLLGTWGEWHCYPHDEWFASKEVQAEVMTSYEQAFQVTPILLRYPAGPDEWAHAPNHNRPFGYHDDSFAWATIPTGRKQDDWFFMPAMIRGGEPATTKWQTQPIGGEIRPELWPCIWKAKGCNEGQDYAACVRQTHATWLMETSTNRDLSPDERERALKAARMLGYEFHIPKVRLERKDAGSMEVVVTIENRGVAPFYYDWKIELGVKGPNEGMRSIATDWKLTGIQPGQSREWRATIEPALQGGDGRLQLRAVNPLKNGKPLRFANKEQDAAVEGWLDLGSTHP